ncbi:MAG TPA: hypothetical protein VFP72_05780 [Kineosporiaceae bacterium]|nr:hypothetical protein [Kineosporiaceae bacterium]
MRLRMLRRHAEELGFTPQEEVRWLAPVELWRTAVKVGLSSVFADYADRREVQAALPALPIELPPDADGGAWVDFVADLGDGFDPTFTVACLIARHELEVHPPQPDHPGAAGGDPLRLPRGGLLVLGGDEVYPTPSAIGYEDRTTGPYRAALLAAGPPPGPVTGQSPAGPMLVALPGNHDWYDGLTAFLRVFTQRRPIGGWRTQQTRSYFAVKLPQRWWLVGLDTQLGTYIDDPQIRYFREHLSDLLAPGDGVIVCAPTPTWVHTGEGEPDAFNALHFFERDVVRRRLLPDGNWTDTGATVRLWITGDRHHYARYAEQLPGPQEPGPGQARQLVTCGLGGAYLLDTHRLPTRLVLPPPESRLDRRVDPAVYRLQERWPSARRSRRLAAGLFAGPPRGLPFRNPGLWPLAGVVHALALMVGLLPLLGLQLHLFNPAATLRVATLVQAVQLAWQSAVWVGAAVLAGCLLPLLRARRPQAPPEWVRAAVPQLVVGFAGLFGVLAVPWPSSWPDWVALGLAALGAAVVDGLVACFALALYIATSSSRLVHGWQFSAQAIEDWKGFVRIRVDGSGRLTLFPIVVDTVCRDWELVDGPAPGSKRPVPAGELPVPHLVEAPIVLNRVPGRATADQGHGPAELVE